MSVPGSQLEESAGSQLEQGAGEDPRTTRSTGSARSSRSIDELLAEARSTLARVTPQQARQACIEQGAVLIDIRPVAQREQGAPTDAVVIDRNVLEWRLDPSSDAKLPIAAYDLPVILICQQGYSSSLAAATLQQLGIWRATDVIGGYEAWRAAGLA